MPDKLTDNEIIMALECCSLPHCNNRICPMFENPINTKDCITKLSMNALDLIKRQKAEIERLQNILLCFMGALGKVRNVDDIDSISMIPIMTELNKGIRAEIKAEAVKEFAERLNKPILSQLGISTLEKNEAYYFCLDLINNLLKEMEGEGDA